MAKRLFAYEHPGATRIRCTGTLALKDGEVSGVFEVVFLLHRGPVVELLNTTVNLQTPVALSLETLDGASLEAVTDEGERVCCDRLMAVSHNFSFPNLQSEALFLPLEPVRIGHKVEEDELTSICYHITNYFGRDFDLTAGPIIVSCRASETQTQAQKWAEQWRLPVESASLTISGELDRQERDLLVSKIFRLLSFLEGRSVSYARCTETDDSGRTAVVFSASRSVPIPAVYQEVLWITSAQSVLEVILPMLLGLHEQQQDQLLLAVAYLVAAKGESNIQSTTIDLAVVWEVLVDLIVGEPEPLSPEVQELRNALKAAVTAWRKDHKEKDPHGLMGQRITDALEQNPFLDGMKAVLAKYSLSEAKLEIDLKLFKDVRDKIIHEGSSASVLPDPVDHLRMNQHIAFAADVVILRYLGYHGKVYDRRGVGGSKHEIQLSQLEVHEQIEQITDQGE